MVSYFERPGAKKNIYNKPIKFECKMWVAATCRGYYIQFNPYLGVGTVLDPDLGLDGSAPRKFTAFLPKSYAGYNIVTDNFFTSLVLIRHLQELGIFATSIIRAN